MVNIKNLLALADFLETKVRDDQFHLSNYRANQHGLAVAFRSLEDCGTVGCALGWAPFVNDEMSVKPRHFSTSLPGLPAFVDWEKYSEEVFGIRLYSSIFVHLFSSHWGECPEGGSRMGTVNRIREFCIDYNEGEK